MEAAVVDCSTEKLQSINEALEKAKEHLLQSFHNLAGKINEQPELSKLVMNEDCVVAEVVKDDDELKYLAERVRKREDMINELRKRKTHALMGVDDLVQSSEEKPTKALNFIVRDEGEVVKDNDELNFLAETVSKMEDIITDLKKKKEDKMIELQKKKEAKKHLSQRVYNLGRMIDEL